MTYYECDGCGRLDRLVGAAGETTFRPCAACEERTRWTIAFAGDGISP